MFHFFKQNVTVCKNRTKNIKKIYYEDIGHCNISCCQGVNARTFIFLQKVTNVYLSYVNIITIN
jgi:hypothetical protein